MPNKISTYSPRVGTMRGVRATYTGGPYIELSFGGYAPTEVIHVYDYATGTVDARVEDRGGVRRILAEWITLQDEEWPGWFKGYVENARGF